MKKLFIDAGPLLEKRMSGIGNTTLNIVRGLSQDEKFCTKYKICLLVPSNKVIDIQKYDFNDNVHIKRIYIKARIINGLTRFNLLPPMDMIFGKGVYLFPNFKNWPLISSRSITYIHDVCFCIYPEFVQPENLKMLKGSVDIFLRRTSKVVTVSESSKQEILQNFNYVKSTDVAVVPNGVDLVDFSRRGSDEIELLKKEYGLPDSYYMFLSNIEPRKNIETILRAFEQYSPEQRSRVALLIVGGMGWLNGSLIEKIKRMNSQGFRIVHPSSYVPDAHLPGLMSGAKALIHPAFHEGFGISPLQAMACETPVIISRIPSLEEVVADVGYYLDNPRDAEQLFYLMNSAKARGTERERAEKFAWSKSTTELIRVINEVEDE